MIEINDIKNPQDLDEMIRKNNNLVVKFSADWCGPCKVLGTTLKNLEPDEVGDVLFGEVDVDNDEFADVFTLLSIRNLPTLVYFYNGELVDRIVGLSQKNEIIEFINKNRNK